ncbi:MAG: phosphate/phosphite/phosphonate ABC transporter substrate-binding protein [Pseudomonadales bacterium]|jgi:phosphonate transport system substrate-binding protein|nr:phosphate/phosphite/phosphonate ABC transporter substrate-binding protein [Pseudomonadales bacterium]MDP7360510.1 phosphate/phosphite/phosphonate ABC transporter substrate-binding protein [Pseudomonadales bacterium]MDP7594429.1 phosphate/phosphite/phosphonate ABC transporter substrate-binding protein [Pseudomonadales bacterium]HJN50967.1 phosphate/phosphite/phosphonate ABC transporter substrate-binding protein [Pseudomonadales bacterium]|tara:strand:- start:938 stop:1987 length:1050 start_codon:yes stop_codon:yes gene_type:complete
MGVETGVGGKYFTDPFFGNPMHRNCGKQAVVVLLVVFVLTIPLMRTEAAVGDCRKGDLDSRFCDQNGDLVADLPEDERAWLDPATLIFAYTPVEDPAVYREVWSEFLDHLKQVTGKPVVFFPVQSNAAQLEAMRSGRLHVAGFNTGSTPLAVNCAGFVPFTMMAARDGTFGYQMEIISWPGSGIEVIGDLKGRTLAFSSPTSNSGFKAPSAILRSKFNLVADRDFSTVFSGKHDNTVLGVVHRDYDAGAIANSVKIRMISRQVIREADVKVLYRSETFPTTAYGHAHNLQPRLAERVRSAFASFNWQGSRLLAEFQKSGDESFIPISYRERWGVIREIDAANDVSYACR